MKYSLSVIMACMMLLACAHAWTNFQFQSEYDMLEYMRDEDHNVYVVFFYNSEQDTPAKLERMKQIVILERNLIKTNVLDQFENIVYAELDLAKGAYEEAAHTIGIDVDATLEYPTIVVVDDGVGKWVHGPNSVQLVVPIVRALVERNKQ